MRDLWKMRGYPEVLIFLDMEPATANARQGRSDWTLAAQLNKPAVAHARAACDLYLPTDELAPDEVADQVERFIATPTL